MNHHHPLTKACRAKALEAGMWQQTDGRMVRLRDMHSAHLINAYLGVLAAGEPLKIHGPLAEEVIRRGLQERCCGEARKREGVAA